jgi:hypothetical protein
LGLLHVSEPGSKPQSHEKEPVALLHAAYIQAQLKNKTEKEFFSGDP